MGILFRLLLCSVPPHPCPLFLFPLLTASLRGLSGGGAAIKLLAGFFGAFPDNPVVAKLFFLYWHGQTQTYITRTSSRPSHPRRQQLQPDVLKSPGAQRIDENIQVEHLMPAGRSTTKERSQLYGASGGRRRRGGVF